MILSIALAASLLLVAIPTGVAQRRGLQPDALQYLIRGADYTFHTICDNYMNPDLFFNELVHRNSIPFSRKVEVWG